MAGKTKAKRRPAPPNRTGAATAQVVKDAPPPKVGAKPKSGAKHESSKRRLPLLRRKPAPAAARTTARGRYTAPIPRKVRRSPRWYPWVLLGLLLVGILCIILNYIQVLPASPTNWYVVGGLVAILTAALMATRYR